MMRWRQALSGAAVMVTAAALTGCALGPQMREQPVSYDLGPPRSHGQLNPGIPATLLVPEVSAPNWLDGQGIIYRLSYENAARPQAYAHSRWAAAPAALLTQRLRSRAAAAGGSGVVSGSDGARADYALRIELEDFSQVFHAPHASRVAVRARASLVSLADRALLAQRVFTVERAAPTPDARGAVAALAAASDDIVERMLEWTGERLAAARSK